MHRGSGKFFASDRDNQGTGAPGGRTWPTLCSAATAVLFVGAGAACGTPPAGTGASGTPGVASAVTEALPAGDAKAGRQAFLDLRCTTCHAVPSEADFPLPVGANQGPPIVGGLGTRDVSYLVTAIASPSHEISMNTSEELKARLEGVLSPMGDFSEAMTVRQLVDLLAYVRSVEEP